MLILAVVGLAALASAQTPGPIGFGREPGVLRGGEQTEDQTRFSGRADMMKDDGDIVTYRGNVTLQLPDSKVTLRADEATYDSAANEFTLAGNVRVTLDSK
jgi:lipopolysaccharide assembly outer membrane protein LptD (OstA)